MDRREREHTENVREERDSGEQQERTAINVESLHPGVYVEETSLKTPIDGEGNPLDVMNDGPAGTEATTQASLHGYGTVSGLAQDLEPVSSAYIGETEKNLASQLDGAEGAGGNLLFDEADALFGKRTEVKDSHDRFGNQEVSGSEHDFRPEIDDEVIVNHVVPSQAGDSDTPPAANTTAEADPNSIVNQKIEWTVVDPAEPVAASTETDPVTSFTEVTGLDMETGIAELPPAEIQPLMHEELDPLLEDPLQTATTDDDDDPLDVI